MADICFSNGDECFHDCPECNSYRAEVDCQECGNSFSRTEIDKYDGMCHECRLKEEFDNRELLDEFFKDNPEIEQAYLDYLDEGWNR